MLFRSGWITDVSAAILAIPFKVFQGLIDMAQNVGGMDELRQAIENIRKEFGALRGPAASTVIDVSKSMKNFSQTGLSTFQVFGMLHERLNLVRELAVAMGPAFGLLLDEFKDNGGAVLAYQNATAVDKNGNSWAFPIPASEVAGYQATDEIRYLVTGR